MDTVNKNSWAVFWGVAWFIFMFMYALFCLGQLSHFPSCFGAGVTNFNEPPSSFLLPLHYYWLGAGAIPFRAVVNNKQCETSGLFMSLVIHYWIGDVQDSPASEMTYIVSGGALVVTAKRTGPSLTPLLTVGGLSRESPPTVRKGYQGPSLSVGGQPTLPRSPLVL